MKSASVDQLLTDVQPSFPDSISNCAKAEQVAEHGVQRSFKSNDRFAIRGIHDDSVWQ
jgi:hypothetical protein